MKQVLDDFFAKVIISSDTCDGGLWEEAITPCPSRDADCFSCPDQGTCLFALNGLGPSVCSEVLKDHEDQNIQNLCSGLSCLDYYYK